MSKPTVRYGYMCSVDFYHEVGEGNAPGGVTVYQSVKEIRALRPCVNECGIVRVKIELANTIQEPKYD